MQTITQTLSNGNTLTYKIINNTAYKINTPDQVVNILENARVNNNRIRLFYGNTETGSLWLEEHDIMGYIGRSTGEIKVPILLFNKSSMGGGAILDDCILKITCNKKILYLHENYQEPELLIRDTQTFKNYTKAVYRKHKDKLENVANFKSLEKAQNYIDFQLGLRNTI